MRYDQTVPLARIVSQYQNVLPLPFKRYQVQPVWRAENTQRGRYREFIQCDIDTVGVDSSLADADLIATIIQAYQALGFENFKVLVNDRETFGDLSTEAITVIDKLKKIGKEKVYEELIAKKIVDTLEEAQTLLQSLLEKTPTERLQTMIQELENLGIDTSLLEFSPTLARGLDYYTGVIIEIESPDYPYGSLGGGGRYDNLIGMFAGKQIPAVGFAFGFDRTMEAIEALQLFPAELALSTTQVLVTIFSEEFKKISFETLNKLREKNISAEIYLGEIKEKNPLEKQLKYADQKMIPLVIILGSKETEQNLITVKDMSSGEQQTISLEEFLATLLEA